MNTTEGAFADGKISNADLSSVADKEPASISILLISCTMTIYKTFGSN